MTESDARKILGVKDNASPQAIKSAFRRLAKKHHPDMKGGSAVRFREVENAYSLLINRRRPSFTQSKPKEETGSSYKPTENFIDGTVYVFDFGHNSEMMIFRWRDRKYIYKESIYITKERLTTKSQSEYFKNLKINIRILRLDFNNEDYVKEDYNTLVYYVKVSLFSFLTGKTINLPPINPYFKPIPVFPVESVYYEPLKYHQRIETHLTNKLQNTNVHKIYADVTFDPHSLPLGSKIFYQLWKLKELLKRKAKPTVK